MYGSRVQLLLPKTMSRNVRAQRALKIGGVSQILTLPEMRRPQCSIGESPFSYLTLNPTRRAYRLRMLTGENIAILLTSGVTREGGRDEYNRVWRNSRNTTLRRDSRCVYVLTWAATPNHLCVGIGRTLEKPLLLAKFFTEKFFKEFLFSKLVNNAVIDDSRRQAIGSNTFLLIEFQ